MRILLQKAIITLTVWLFCRNTSAQTLSAALTYRLHCSGCHELDGTRNVAGGIPAIRGFIGNFLRTEQGRAFLVQVPGVSNSPLSASEIAAVLNWMLDTMGERSVPPDSPPYTTAEVARLLTHKVSDIPALRARIEAELEEKGFPIDKVTP